MVVIGLEKLESATGQRSFALQNQIFAIFTKIGIVIFDKLVRFMII